MHLLYLREQGGGDDQNPERTLWPELQPLVEGGSLAPVGPCREQHLLLHLLLPVPPGAEPCWRHRASKPAAGPDRSVAGGGARTEKMDGVCAGVHGRYPISSEGCRNQ